MEDRRILIKGGTVVTLEGPDGDGRVADVLVVGSRIAAIAPSIAAGDAQVIDAAGMLVMPGFVDTHRHTWQTAFRGIGSDWSLAQYAKGMHGILKPHYTPEDVYIGNLMGRVEALHSGITTMLDWSHGILSPEHADAAAQGLFDAPGRSVFAYAGGLGFPSDEPIRAELVRLRKGRFAGNTGRVTLALGLRGPQYSSLDCTESDVRLARELDLQVSVHGGSAGWGRNRPVGRMHDRGLLDERTTVIHCNTLADDELSMMADCGCSASVSPDVEIQMGFGWPATGRLLAAGIRPSLSIDDCAAIGGDMFGTMHTALIVQRGLDNAAVDHPTDQTGLRLRSRDVVEFATLEGARACGLAGRIGSLAVGKEADILLLRLDDPTFFPVNHALGSLVAAGHPGLVDTVLVAGEVVKRAGKLVGVDLDRLRAMVLESRERVMARANANPLHPGCVHLGGCWHPPVDGFTADAVNPRE